MTAASTSAAAALPRHKIRRRRADKPAITSRLILDDHIKSDVGILSADLFADLFPHLRNSTDDSSEIHHIAIAPWTPNASATGGAWCIVPVARSSSLPHSTVHFSPSSTALQSFAVTLQKIAPSKLTSHSRSGIEILVLDVATVPLETVFVSLEKNIPPSRSPTAPCLKTAS
ncbi:hypothetical protein NLG97_g10509 [Lecanicillium saksenae]|uniref:Uncharacterized protein n=1 Tax=Lecanicillium saksenae TaxID=468837 RepID=A0ACC1QD81_9HYPO|nr:hypothetical protein NLG97_g10509 [Lecanicillium saksenae]